MTSFLLIISFLLHVLVLFVVFQLFKQLQSSKKESTRDITDLFDVYLQEIKDENKRLQDEIINSSPQPESEPSDRTSKPSIKNKQGHTITKDKSEYNTHLIPPTEDIDDNLNTSLQAKVLQLYDQGLSEEDIAKKLNRGKTEVSLIINIYAKRSHKA